MSHNLNYEKESDIIGKSTKKKSKPKKKKKQKLCSIMAVEQGKTKRKNVDSSPPPCSKKLHLQDHSLSTLLPCGHQYRGPQGAIITSDDGSWSIQRYHSIVNVSLTCMTCFGGCAPGLCELVFEYIEDEETEFKVIRTSSATQSIRVHRNNLYTRLLDYSIKGLGHLFIVRMKDYALRMDGGPGGASTYNILYGRENIPALVMQYVVRDNSFQPDFAALPFDCTDPLTFVSVREPPAETDLKDVLRDMLRDADLFVLTWTECFFTDEILTWFISRATVDSRIATKWPTLCIE